MMESRPEKRQRSQADAKKKIIGPTVQLIIQGDPADNEHLQVCLALLEKLIGQTEPICSQTDVSELEEQLCIAFLHPVGRTIREVEDGVGNIMHWTVYWNTLRAAMGALFDHCPALRQSSVLNHICSLMIKQILLCDEDESNLWRKHLQYLGTLTHLWQRPLSVGCLWKVLKLDFWKIDDTEQAILRKLFVQFQMLTGMVLGAPLKGSRWSMFDRFANARVEITVDGPILFSVSGEIMHDAILHALGLHLCQENTLFIACLRHCWSHHSLYNPHVLLDILPDHLIDAHFAYLRWYEESRHGSPVAAKTL